MFLKEDAFEVTDDGIIIEGGPHIIGGTASPISLTPDNPTVYIQSNGNIWTNSGSGPWKNISNFNFSFKRVDEEVIIPTNQQMIVQGCFEVTENGCFEIEQGSNFVLNKEGL